MTIHDGKEETTAVAIDKDKGSQHALKWAVDHLLNKGQYVTLLHVKQRPPTIAATADVSDVAARAYKEKLDSEAKELFLPFRVFCTRKDIHCNEVLIEEMDIAKGIIDYVTNSATEVLVLGSPSKGGFMRRFKTTDMPSFVSKGAPDFCTVYIINKGKISSVRSSTRPSPVRPRSNMQNQPSKSFNKHPDTIQHRRSLNPKVTASPERSPNLPRIMSNDSDFRSPFTRPSANKSYEPSLADTDISYVSSGRPSTDRLFPFNNDNQLAHGAPPRMSIGSDHESLYSFGSLSSGSKSMDISSSHFDFSNSQEGTSWSSQSSEDVEAEMRRLKLELKQTIDMYSTACKEALTANQRAVELQRWKMEEEQRLEEARLAEEAALAIAEKEKAKCREALEAAEAAQRIAELEAQKRRSAEMKAIVENDENNPTSLRGRNLSYRRYTIEEIEKATEYFLQSRKIGEGGYGPVYKGTLDHTQVAIKVLRPDASQGRSQFQQEIEVLSCIRHPNMVLLLGACPEYGCLVYEYMANGSLEDRLMQQENTPILSWQIRFRIAAEIATGLLFLHQTKPEPLVHRDLKPANILLDRNYVSKISDVGLARLVPPSVANSVTQYHMTATAGTFCYIDPEYQQTGMLGVKSDIYSLGVMLLQMITAKPPMGLTHHVEQAIEGGNLEEMLDPGVPDWPVDEACKFAELSLQCAQMRRKDRPDLGRVIVPELNRLRALAEDNMPNLMYMGVSPFPSSASASQGIMSDPQLTGYQQSRSHPNTIT